MCVGCRWHRNFLCFDGSMIMVLMLFWNNLWFADLRVPFFSAH